MNDGKQIRVLMIFEWVLKTRRWKLSYVSLRKGKGKNSVCLGQEVISILFESYAHLTIKRDITEPIQTGYIQPTCT
jgi:hypothetical protein